MSSLPRATAVMSVGTILSRITGLLRLAAISAAIGIVASGRLADTYHLGNTVPNILYELVLGGVLTSVFVPVFVEVIQKEGREKAWEVASAILNLSILILGVLTIAGILAAPLIAKFYSGGLEGAEAVAQQRVLTFLVRLFIPQIIFYGIYAVTSGLLNAHKRFGPPMYTPVLGNIAVIAVFVVFHQAYSRIGGLTRVTETQLLIIGLGTTLGIVLQGVGQLPFLRGLGRYRATLSLSHPSVRKLAKLSVFVIGYVIANQVGYLIVQFLANKQTGGYSAYVTAFTFYMLPHGLFAVSVITALLPGMSEHAVNRDWDAYRHQLSTGVRATMLLVLPAAVGYLIVGEPVVRVLLEHGVMGTRDTELVAGVLRFFVLGLVPFSLFQLLLRAFYALQDTKTPFLVNCVAVGLNTAVNIPLFLWLGVDGLAAGHALAYSFGAAALAISLRRRIGGLDGRRIGSAALKIAGAAAAMGGVTWLMVWGAQHLVDTGTLAGAAIAVTASVTAGVLTYAGVAFALGVEELGFVKSALRRQRPA